MVDTVRTLAALQALLADNTDGDISAQDVRDLAVSVFPPQFSGARIYNSGSQVNIDGSGADVTVQFDTAAFDTDSYFDNANDALVAPADGYYLVVATCVLLNTDNLEVGFSVIQVDGVDDTNIWYRRDTAHPGDRVGFNGSAILTLSAGEAVTMIVSTLTQGTVNEVDISSSAVNTTLQIVRLGQTPA